MTDAQLPLFGDDPVEGAPVPTSMPTSPQAVPDQTARQHAENPQHNVVLEASAGTGKTTVLVNRYLNLLRAGVDPSNILAVTFTRKAAAEMRDRIIAGLRRSAETDSRDRVLWLSLRNRLGEVAISTIDAFCYNLLREFPLEADLDPGFSLADETAVARLVEETLDYTLRVVRAQAREDDDLALLLAQMPPARLRSGLSMLLSRRVVAESALNRYLAGAGRAPSAAQACRDHARQMLSLLERAGALDRFLSQGPAVPVFALLVRDIETLRATPEPSVSASRAVIDGLVGWFLTEAKTVRQRLQAKVDQFPTREAYNWHVDTVKELGPQVDRVRRSLNRALNAVLARAMRKTFAIALREYRRVLAEYDVLDFSEALTRSVRLLAQMDEFAQSRYRLESRYHHVLLDEFQDTSQLQWDLVSALVRSWGEGFGLVHEAPLAPTVFVVGDRKQSIYRFRDAEVAVLDRASDQIAALRGESSVRHSISTSFRSSPALLAFINAFFSDMDRGGRDDAFRYGESDRFPLLDRDAAHAGPPALGIATAEEPADCARVVAEEIGRLLAEGRVRDPHTGVTRPVSPKDVAILFRSRESHREFERALERRGIPTYVYKGLGFFDADEVRDVTALMRFLAAPSSNLRAAALLRSGIVGLSDGGLARLAPGLASALTDPDPPAEGEGLSPVDHQRLTLIRTALRTWLPLVDRVPPAELVDRALASCAYAYEMRGPRRLQARENLKKLRALVRRIQNRGYASLARIADHVDRLSAGDESHAVLDALDAVSLMTIHAAKGLEFPVVFLVNLSRGVGTLPPPVRVLADGGLGEPVVGVAPFADEASEEERRREREETKRLLYVAATRARDFLYFGSLTKDGLFKSSPGSLGEVLPPGFDLLFSQAAITSDGQATWSSTSGKTFTFRVCRPGLAAPMLGAAATGPGEAHHQARIAPALSSRVRVLTVSEVLTAGTPVRTTPGQAGAAVHGRLVHRLLARGVATLEEATTLAGELWPASERAGLTADTVERESRAAAEAAITLRHREDVQNWLSEAKSLYEVPFSMVRRDPGGTVVVRGAMDWLLQWPDGRVAVVEVKTGSSHPDHERQLDLYVEAARATFPGKPVVGHLLYA